MSKSLKISDFKRFLILCKLEFCANLYQLTLRKLQNVLNFLAKLADRQAARSIDRDARQ